MNTETSELPPLPNPVVEHGITTYHKPHVLRAASDGQATIREGGEEQTETSTEIFFTTEKQEQEVFKMVARNGFNFGGHTLQVLNDAGEYNGQRLLVSVPSASEYMEAVGKKAVTFFMSTPITKGAFMDFVNKDATTRHRCIYKNIRTTTLIP